MEKFVFLPSFLTRRTERLLEKMSRRGYRLYDVREAMPFGYYLTFHTCSIVPRRYYVFCVDDIGRADRFSFGELERQKLGDRCEPPVYSDSRVLFAAIWPDVPDQEIDALIRDRLKNTIRYHAEIMLVWLVLPVVPVLLSALCGDKVSHFDAGCMLAGLLAALEGAVALYCQWERRRLRHHKT